MVDSSPRSKRMSLRFSTNEHEIQYKTAYEDGTAQLLNISGGGCALQNLDVKVQQQEKILLLIVCEDEEDPIEIGGIVLRVEGNNVAVQFSQLSEDSKQRMIKYFAKKMRQKRAQ